MSNEIKTLGEAIDALEDFLDDMDEYYGLCALRYGERAADALEFLYDYRLDQLNKMKKGMFNDG